MMQLLLGNCLDVLRTMEDNSVDSIITDPPYGLGAIKDIAGFLTAWLHDLDTAEHVGSGGFMNKEWDREVPHPRIWKEVRRVLKPGGYVCCFAGTRTTDLMTLSLRLAGFEIKDTLQWLYGSGFPKSLDVSKAIDKAEGANREVVGKRQGTFADIRRNKETGQDNLHGGVVGKPRVEAYITAPATDAAKQFDGYKTALKPAYEPIILALKPPDGTYAQNAITYGVAGLNIDGSRVATTEASQTMLAVKYGDSKAQETHQTAGQVQGRYPANIILQHDDACVCIGTRKIKNTSGSVSGKEPSHTGDENTVAYGEFDRVAFNKYGDTDGMEEIEHWECVDGCPIKVLDEQSGIRPGCTSPSDAQPESIYRPNQGKYQKQGPIYPDTGGASRFFTNLHDDGVDEQFLYASKASKKERNAGCEELEKGCNHPTIKPLKIMEWLCTLTKTPTGGVVLDPFMGSGTTGIACLKTGRDFIGIELEEEYFKLAELRIKYWQDQQAQTSTSE